MKVELKKINEPSGRYWYGIWVDGSCQIPAYGDNLQAATDAYNQILENQKNPPVPKEEIILSTEIPTNEPANS